MGYTKEQEDYILLLCELSDNNQGLASRMYREKFRENITPATIASRWEKYIPNYQSRSKGGANYGIPKTEFIKIHRELDGDIMAIAEKTNFKPQSILSRCYALNLDYKNSPIIKKKNKRRNICDKFVD